MGVAVGASNSDGFVQASLERYSALRTYKDEGALTLQSPDGITVLCAKFRTLYRTPNRFRFDYLFGYPSTLKKLGGRYCVTGVDENGTFNLTAKSNGEYRVTEAVIRNVPSVSIGIAELAGISYGAVSRFAAMWGLLPMKRGLEFEVSDLADSKVSYHSEGSTSYTSLATPATSEGFARCTFRSADKMLVGLVVHSKLGTLLESRNFVIVNSPISLAEFHRHANPKLSSISACG